MGMWTGMLNNKVGNFKFIYVDVISEEEAAPKKMKTQRRSGMEKPETLQEFLERIHLQVSKLMACLILMAYRWNNWEEGISVCIAKNNIWLTARENLFSKDSSYLPITTSLCMDWSWYNITWTKF